MARKKKRKTLDKGKEARRAARQSGMAPAVTRVIPDKRKTRTKHKRDWTEEVFE